MNSPGLSVSIIIPTFNGLSLLKRNLPQVITASPGTDIIVVDDASTDGTTPYLQTHFPNVKVARHSRNRRFAAACNTGVQIATGDIIVLLNNDVIPKSGWLKPLLIPFSDPQVFAVGCAESDGGRISGRSGGNYIRGLYIHWRTKDQNGYDTLWAAGGSSAYRRNHWLKLGGMDLAFTPAYEEDRDLCYRALKMGYRVLFAPASRVIHLHETSNLAALGRGVMDIASWKNQYLFVWKNITSRKLIIQHLYWLPYQLLIGGLKSRGKSIQGFIWALKYLPAIWQQRQIINKYSQVSDEEIIHRFRQI